MKEIQKTTPDATEITSPQNEFRGYTLDEIRYQRALVTLHKEFCKSKIIRNIEAIKDTNPLSPSSDTKGIGGKMGFLARKLMSGLNYLDYAVVGYSVFGSIRKALSIFRHKRR